MTKNYLIIGFISLFFIFIPLAYFKGKEAGINETENEYLKQEQEQERLHDKKIQKLNNSLKNVKYDKKRDYNFTGNLDDDQLLQELQ